MGQRRRGEIISSNRSLVALEPLCWGLGAQQDGHKSHCILASTWANSTLGCVNSSTAGRLREKMASLTQYSLGFFPGIGHTVLQLSGANSAGAGAFVLWERKDNLMGICLQPASTYGELLMRRSCTWWENDVSEAKAKTREIWTRCKEKLPSKHFQGSAKHLAMFANLL